MSNRANGCYQVEMSKYYGVPLYTPFLEIEIYLFSSLSFFTSLFSSNYQMDNKNKRLSYKIIIIIKSIAVKYNKTNKKYFFVPIRSRKKWRQNFVPNCGWNLVVLPRSPADSAVSRWFSSIPSPPPRQQRWHRVTIFVLNRFKCYMINLNIVSVNVIYNGFHRLNITEC